MLRLQAELRAHTYRPGPSSCFVTDGPKPREVFAADFRDRIVHHLLVSHQEPLFAAWREHPWLAVLWRRVGWRLRSRWSVRALARGRTFERRYRALTAQLGEAALAFWPVGRFVEFYGPQRLLAERVLGLRRARLRRAGYLFGVGFPAWQWEARARQALGARVAIIVVGRRARASEIGVDSLALRLLLPDSGRQQDCAAARAHS